MSHRHPGEAERERTGTDTQYVRDFDETQIEHT